MKNLRSKLALFIVALTSVVSFSACDSSYDSAGYPVVNYHIPDLVIGRAEAWSRDLLATPKVFTHTTDAYLYFDAYSNNTAVADAYVRNGFLYVVAGVPGTAKIRVSAEDADGDYVEDEFIVTIDPNAPKR